MEDRIASIEKSLRTVNHELGIVMGKTSIILWLTGGTFLAVAGKIVYDILSGG